MYKRQKLAASWQLGTLGLEGGERASYWVDQHYSLTDKQRWDWETPGNWIQTRRVAIVSRIYAQAATLSPIA